MEEVSVIGIDLEKQSCQVHRGEGGWVDGVLQEAKLREAAELSHLAAKVYGGDGGVRWRQLRGREIVAVKTEAQQAQGMLIRMFHYEIENEDFIQLPRQRSCVDSCSFASVDRRLSTPLLPE